MLKWLKSCNLRLIFAWVLLVVTLIGWPLSIWLTDEPVFILSLSWLALTLTAWDIIQTTEVGTKV